MEQFEGLKLSPIWDLVGDETPVGEGKKEGFKMTDKHFMLSPYIISTVSSYLNYDSQKKINDSNYNTMKYKADIDRNNYIDAMNMEMKEIYKKQSSVLASNSVTANARDFNTDALGTSIFSVNRDVDSSEYNKKRNIDSMILSADLDKSIYETNKIGQNAKEGYAYQEFLLDLGMSYLRTREGY